MAKIVPFEKGHSWAKMSILIKVYKQIQTNFNENQRNVLWEDISHIFSKHTIAVLAFFLAFFILRRKAGLGHSWAKMCSLIKGFFPHAGLYKPHEAELKIKQAKKKQTQNANKQI